MMSGDKSGNGGDVDEKSLLDTWILAYDILVMPLILKRSDLAKQSAITLAQVALLAVLVYTPFLVARFEVMWLNILPATLAMPAWIKLGPRPSHGLLPGSLCLLGMILLIPLFVFWFILGLVVLIE
jgi:hypothetical protein